MNIAITSRNVEIDDALKAYVNKRLEKLERLYDRIYRCEAILAEEKSRKNVEIILHLKRNKVVAKESSPDMYASIDNASENIKKQLRRLKGRVKSKRRKLVLTRVMNPVYRFTRPAKEDLEVSSIISKTDLFAEKPMLPSEAKLEIEMTNKQFIMFKNADTGQANVLYKRNNGTYGMIEPNF